MLDNPPSATPRMRMMGVEARVSPKKIKTAAIVLRAKEEINNAQAMLMLIVSTRKTSVIPNSSMVTPPNQNPVINNGRGART